MATTSLHSGNTLHFDKLKIIWENKREKNLLHVSDSNEFYTADGINNNCADYIIQQNIPETELLYIARWEYANSA